MDTMSSQLGNLRSPVSKPEFHEIDNLTISNLRDIIENESSFDFFFQNTIAVKRACSAHEELMHEIVSAAKSNVMLKSQVEQMTERLYELHGILKIEEGELNEYVNINSALLSKYTQEGVLHSLEKSLESKEIESRTYADQFNSGEIDMVKFSHVYKKSRKDFNLSKIDLLKLRDHFNC